MTAGFALYFFLKSLPLPLITWNVGSVESVGVAIFLAGHKRYACPGTRFLIHPLHWGFGNLVAADHARISEWRACRKRGPPRIGGIEEIHEIACGRCQHILNTPMAVTSLQR